MKFHIQKVIDDITGYMHVAGTRGDHEASNAYDNAIGKVSGLLHVYQSDEPFIVGLSYTDYRPGMKLFLHKDYEHIKANEVLEIAGVNGYDLQRDTYLHPLKKRDLYFITTEGIKIIWNQVPISCFIELDQTTTFLKEMFSHYHIEAEKRLKDPKYEWNQRDHDEFVEDKKNHLLDLIIINEHKRCELARQWSSCKHK